MDVFSEAIILANKIRNDLPEEINKKYCTDFGNFLNSLTKAGNNHRQLAGALEKCFLGLSGTGLRSVEIDIKDAKDALDTFYKIEGLSYTAVELLERHKP